MNTGNTSDIKGAWPTFGSEAVVSFLDKSIVKERLAQTYIFTGPADLGKFTMAVAFARNLLAKDIPAYASQDSLEDIARDESNLSGFSGDIHVLKILEGKQNISIEQTRDFIKMLGLSSFLNSYKVGIIRGAERLSLEAANALLKTLEEPRGKAIIILTVDDLSALPATITSRGQVIYFYPLSSELIYDYLLKQAGCERGLARDLANLSSGRPLRALKFLNNPEFYEAYLNKARVIIKAFSQPLNDRLMSLAQIFPGRLKGREATLEALNILEIWQSLVRDLLMISLNNPELVQHSVFMIELKEALKNLQADFSDEEMSVYLNGLLERMEHGFKYLEANVGSIYVLENILINL